MGASYQASKKKLTVSWDQSNKEVMTIFGFRIKCMAYRVWVAEMDGFYGILQQQQKLKDQDDDFKMFQSRIKNAKWLEEPLSTLSWELKSLMKRVSPTLKIRYVPFPS